MATFVLIPGAWLGAWAWEDTARALRGHGRTVLPLTLTGLAERAEAAAPVTGTAGLLGDRLERVVYVDSAPFAAGMYMPDLMPPRAAIPTQPERR
ncbi:hypothetical protein AB0N17_31970 [Streptomyces sp. NPDC051133]|uniref:hypothetical protein n=1 Tax=Streptomyces sp. NPDC051133 TaxID=3155521 RepID=UPI00343E31FE